jgi:hypothetical protein
MPTDFDVLYPAKERQGYDGGKNNKYEKHLILDNESPDCLNVVFGNGAVETRPGSLKFNTATVGSYVGDGLYVRHDRSGAETMVAWWNGSLYFNSGTTFNTVPSAQSIYTAGVRVAAAEYENYIFFGNGTTPYKYNGAFTRHGIPAPTVTMTVASTNSGLLTGEYLYKLTNVNSNLVESDAGVATVSYTATSGQLTITGIPTAPVSHGVNTRRLYRTKASSFATYFLVTAIADNVTSTVVDNKTDLELGVAAPDDAGEPPNYSIILTHQNRLWCNDTANPNLLWFSDIDSNAPNPYVFKATSFIFVGDGSGDLIRGLSIHDNGLLIFTDRSVYLLYLASTDESDWSLVKLRSSFGSKSPFGFFSYENKVMFPAMQNSKVVGFAAISGDAVDPEATLLTVSSAGSETKSDRIEPDIFEIQETYVGNISAMVFQNKAYITVTYGTSETINNRLFVYDFSISNLSKRQAAAWVPWTGLSASQFTVFGGKLYFQDSTATGFVREMLKAGVYSDDGASIDSYFWTKEFSGIPGDEQTFKDFRYTNLLYEKAGNYFMNLNYRVDSDIGDGNTLAIDLNPGGSLWGTAVMGVDTWGGGSANGEDRLYLGQLRGKRVQFRFSNQDTVNQKFKIIGQQFSYNRKGRR